MTVASLMRSNVSGAVASLMGTSPSKASKVAQFSQSPRKTARMSRRNAGLSVRALSQDELKQQAAFKAVEYVQSGTAIGLGTGSTAAFAVARIGQLLKEGKLKDVVAVPTSIKTYEQAKSLGIPLATLAEEPKLSVVIDGADEVDPNLDVVKGRGGALLREKMVELASDTFVCIVDESKLVDGLGGSKDAMPVEIVQFCWDYNLERLRNLPEAEGLKEAKRRMDGDKPYVTDNSNYIIDLYFDTPIKDSKKLAEAISKLCGVVDHGLFLDMVDVVIIAGSNGIEVKKRN